MRSNKEVRALLRLWLWYYLKQHPCIDCGESDPLVLHFDHKDTETKAADISRMVSDRRSLNKIKHEISKCDVRCANCHSKRTATQFNWYKGSHSLMSELPDMQSVEFSLSSRK